MIYYMSHKKEIQRREELAVRNVNVKKRKEGAQERGGRELPKEGQYKI